MRLSTDKADPGYSPTACLARVWLAGAERTTVITADEEKRYALITKLDADGRIVVKDGQIQTEEFWGDVRIEPAQVVGATWPSGYDDGLAYC